MKKHLRKISVLILLLFSSCLYSQTLDINKYIGLKSYVKNLSYNFITKSGRSFNHILTLYKKVKYNIYVFSSNPDITISIMDSNKIKTYDKITKYTVKDRYYYFTGSYTPTFDSRHNIVVRANKSEDFRYYFLATYEVEDAKSIPEKQNKTILAFDNYARTALSKDEIDIEGRKYFRRLIGFLYFPNGQYNFRYLYEGNVFMAQSFTMDNNQRLTFFPGSDTKKSASTTTPTGDMKMPSGFEDFKSKYFVSTIKEDSLYTIHLKADDPTILLSYRLIENKTTSGIDLALTKPVPERTDRFIVNLAGYVTNWVEGPDNYVVVNRYNGEDKTQFKLDPNLVGNVFNFDLNIPLIPGENKLIIEAYVNGEKKTIQKTVYAESYKKSLMVELTWDTHNTDMDLYVMKPDGEVVCFENQNENNPSKGWLDIDDKDGYGPERFRMDAPKKGKYKFYAHYYNGNVLTNLTVKVITGGAIKEFKGKLKTSSKTNSSIDNIGKGPDWILLGDAEVQ